MDMTGKTGATSARSVTTKIYAMNFKQQKTDLNAERKKNALLEQRLREMEAVLATGGISSNKIDPNRGQRIYHRYSRDDHHHPNPSHQPGSSSSPC